MKKVAVLKRFTSLAIAALVFAANIYFTVRMGISAHENFFNKYQYDIEKNWRTGEMNLWVMAESFFWDNPKNDTVIGIATDKKQGNWVGNRYIFTHTKNGIAMTYQVYEVEMNGGIGKIYSEKITKASDALLSLCIRGLLFLIGTIFAIALMADRDCLKPPYKISQSY